MTDYDPEEVLWDALHFSLANARTALKKLSAMHPELADLNERIGKIRMETGSRRAEYRRKFYV